MKNLQGKRGCCHLTTCLAAGVKKIKENLKVVAMIKFLLA
jgi:hypothetical protein